MLWDSWERMQLARSITNPSDWRTISNGQLARIFVRITLDIMLPKAMPAGSSPEKNSRQVWVNGKSKRSNITSGFAHLGTGGFREPGCIQQLCFSFLQFNRFGSLKVSVLIVENDMTGVMAICLRVADLDYCKTIAEGSAHELQQRQAEGRQEAAFNGLKPSRSVGK
jgi:hypothetical protein